MGSYTLAGGRISEDDEVQFLYKASPAVFSCQICQQNLSKLNERQRQVHYDDHFGPDTSSDPQSRKSSLKLGTKARKLIPKMRESDAFWFPSQEKPPPPPNFSPGLIPVLRKALIKSHAKGKTQRAVLCYDGTVHISREPWDARWGCGYRNYLMACTALMNQSIQPMYFPLLDDPVPPGVRNLQKTIEAAWRDGYDEDGARELENEIVETNKRIGTAELYTAFTYRRIPAELVDFDHKDQDSVVKLVTEWVVQYFSPSGFGNVKVSVDDALRGASPVTCTNKMPLILQHSGHSRTIVGYEVSKSGVFSLLTFDPSRAVKKKIRNAGLAYYSSTLPSTYNGQSVASSSVMQRILQPSHRNKRRTVDDVPSHGNMTKRVRSIGPKENMSDDEIIIVDGPSDSRSVDLIPKQQEKQKVLHSSEDQLDPFDTINFFRLDPKILGRKKQYQILHFPLGEPLSPQEQVSRKVVRSTKIR